MTWCDSWVGDPAKRRAWDNRTYKSYRTYTLRLGRSGVGQQDGYSAGAGSAERGITGGYQSPEAGATGALAEIDALVRPVLVEMTSTLSIL